MSSFTSGALNRSLFSSLTSSLLGFSSAVTLAAGGGVQGPSLNDYGPANVGYFAHRGGALRAPENTLEAFEDVVANDRGDAIELDVHSGSDGTLAVMHDTTVDRTTTGTGAVASLNAAAWAALNIDADARGGTIGWTNTIHSPTLPAVLSELKGDALLFVDLNVTTVKTTAVQAAQAAGWGFDQLCFTCNGLADLSVARAAGYQTSLTATSDTPTADIASALAVGTDWVAVEKVKTDAVFQEWIASGIKTVAYTVNRRYDRDRFLALGISGFYTDDAEYLKGNGPLAAADDFASGKWGAGMISGLDSESIVQRGALTSGGYFGWTGDNSGYRITMLGNLGTVGSTQKVVQLTAKMTFDSVLENTRHGNVFLTAGSMSDRPFQNSSALLTDSFCNWYRFRFTKQGNMNIFSCVNGTETQIGGTEASAAPAFGEEVSLKIERTATHVIFSRLDGSGVATDTLSVANTDHPDCKAIHLGTNACATRWRAIGAVHAA